jgi:hypothetical protein
MNLIELATGLTYLKFYLIALVTRSRHFQVACVITVLLGIIAYLTVGAAVENVHPELMRAEQQLNTCTPSQVLDKG